MIRVLLADDHQLVRDGIARMLADARDITVVAQVASGEDAVERVREVRPSVVLMDLRMPGIGGLEATRRIVRMDPDVGVIALTMCTDEPFPSQLLRAGARGYVSKEASAVELAMAVRRVHVGQRYLSAEVARVMALRALEPDVRSPFEELSAREMQVALMVAGCHRVSAISERLHLSPKTVNSYRYRIFDKLQIDSDVELALMALRHGLVDLPGRAAAAG